MSAHQHGFKVGDRVICNPAEVPARLHNIIWIIESFARVNATLRPVNGGRGLRISPSALLPAQAEGAATLAPVTIPFLPQLPVGAVVTVAAPTWRGGDGLYVVLADNGEHARLAALGGNDHRYWRKIPRRWITEVDRTALLTAVASLRRPS